MYLLMNSLTGSLLMKTSREVFLNLIENIFFTISETSNWTLLDIEQIFYTVQRIFPDDMKMKKGI